MFHSLKWIVLVFVLYLCLSEVVYASEDSSHLEVLQDDVEIEVHEIKEIELGDKVFKEVVLSVPYEVKELVIAHAYDVNHFEALNLYKILVDSEDVLDKLSITMVTLDDLEKRFDIELNDPAKEYELEENTLTSEFDVLKLLDDVKVDNDSSLNDSNVQQPIDVNTRYVDDVPTPFNQPTPKPRTSTIQQHYQPNLLFNRDSDIPKPKRLNKAEIKPESQVVQPQTHQSLWIVALVIAFSVLGLTLTSKKWKKLNVHDVQG
ncbi:hypothetical protein ACF3N8_02805 [Staphylococcus massiliensis]|uniref:hypothetical protein n=1 Tax=Staphylococcus massiliensis TaxID=555791 RepID=UPI001EDF97A7|nr:hypothetical protein [Staphylococcus massiliensis]MCG3402161.1 hypothetical protein [Staphylococcus massiliensis]MCG3412872.1 hypothetical protein [Staphylococcus massiliensis]